MFLLHFQIVLLKKFQLSFHNILTLYSLSEYFSSTLTFNFIHFFFNVENQVNLDEAYCASAGLSVNSCWSHGNLISQATVVQTYPRLSPIIRDKPGSQQDTEMPNRLSITFVVLLIVKSLAIKNPKRCWG